MGKKSRRQRVPNAASRRGTTTVTSEDLLCSGAGRLLESLLSPEQRAAAIAAIENEFRAASHEQAASREQSSERYEKASAALISCFTVDKDDRRNVFNYIERVTGLKPTVNEYLKLIKRWPRIRKYWPRLRRRICWGCGKEYDLSEPRLWVCSGCEDARYCDEACQRAHWPKHKGPCLQKWHERAKKRQSQGESWQKLQQEFHGWWSKPEES